MELIKGMGAKTMRRTVWRIRSTNILLLGSLFIMFVHAYLVFISLWRRGSELVILMSVWLTRIIRTVDV
jgi:hypothetical protein